MARTLHEDCTELYRVVVTYEWGKRDWGTGIFEPSLSEDGVSKKSTAILGPYGRKAAAKSVVSSVVPYRSTNKRLIQYRIQRLTPVAIETVRTDEFGNRDVKVSAELRWMDA